MPNPEVNSLSESGFATEDDVWPYFDRILEKSKCFKVHKEVVGEYVQARYGTGNNDARIDRLLIPLTPAINAGWLHGAIGIEGKKSETKAGKPVSQALDYTRCAFELQTGVPGLLITPKWIFIYPFESPTGDILSVALNNRIGFCSKTHDGLRFSCGAFVAIDIGLDGSIKVKSPTMGNKRGSRT